LSTATFTVGRGYRENHWADITIALGHELLIVTGDLAHPTYETNVPTGQRMVALSYFLVNAMFSGDLNDSRLLLATHGLCSACPASPV
jgi:hypothetical protein